MMRCVKMNEKMAIEVSTWKYEGEYAMYDLPSWEEMQAKNFSMCSEKGRESYSAYISEEDNLLGFVNLHEEEAFVFFGIGVKPELCGKGVGQEITAMAIKASKEMYPDKPLLLEVRTWNKRAARCYEKQGFKIIEIKKQETYIVPGKFYVMKYEH